MAPKRGGTPKSVLYLNFFPRLSFMMSSKQLIKTLVTSVARNYFTDHLKVADIENKENAVRNFARDGRPQSIGMFFIILSINKLTAKSKYIMGFGVPPK